MARPKSKEIRRFIIDHVREHPSDISKFTAEHFGITRQAVRRHLLTLIEDNVIKGGGETRNRRYDLVVNQHFWRLNLSENPEEDKVWRELIEPVLTDIPDNALKICYYGFTEIYNNAVDHSSGSIVRLVVEVSAKSIEMTIWDDGVGIFEKIKAAFNLEDHRHAILELCKGKLTTDPARHTGQGIFFTSRAFDKFTMYSGHLFFTHLRDGDYLIEVEPLEKPGTAVTLRLSPDSDRPLREVFDRFTDLTREDYPFSKTHVPLSLARYGNDQLISRSQAKRILSRFDRFEEIMLDFAGIDDIGQAFADEIFRVFRSSNPNIKILHMNANARIIQMIRRAEGSSI